MNTNMNKNTYDQKTSFEIDLSDSEMFRSTTLKLTKVDLYAK